MTTPQPQPEGLATILLQLGSLTERIGAVDQREGDHWQQVGDQLKDIATRLTGMTGTLRDQGAILAELEGLPEQVVQLAASVNLLLPEDGDDAPKPYQPASSVRWWELEDADRELAVTRLRRWVRDIYVPGYGTLAAALPACWTRHDFCLYTLDWLSELWMVLYLSPERKPSTPGAQGDFQTRILPAAVQQMTAEARACQHQVMGRAVAGS
jgi:hypothetical protein